MGKTYSVYLSVPVNGHEEWHEINEIAEGVNPNSCGAGTGFGFRDIDWEFKSKKEADSLKTELKKAFKEFEGTEIRVVEDKI